MKLDAEKQKHLEKYKKIEEEIPDIQKRREKRKIREIDSTNVDSTTVTLIKQKNEKLFNDMLLENRELKYSNDAVYPDMSFEK